MFLKLKKKVKNILAQYLLSKNLFNWSIMGFSKINFCNRSTILRFIIGNKSNIDENLNLSFLKKEINLMNMQINWSKILER